MDESQTDAAPMTPVPAPSRPMLPPLGALFRETWAEYRSKAKTYMLIALIPAIIQLVVMGNTMVVLIGMIALIIFSILAQAALLLVATRPAENISFGEAYRKGMAYFWPLVWISILTALLVGGGTVLFIIPGIIMGIWFAFGSVILVAEQDRGLKAILKSREYARDYWGAIFGRLLAMGILVGFVAQIPSFILTGIHQQTVSTIYGMLISLVTIPFATIYSVKLYQQLKDRKSVTEAQVMTAKKKVLQLSLAGYGLLLVIIAVVLYGIAR